MSEVKPFFATTLSGLEPLLAEEFESFGFTNVATTKRGVSFETDYRGMVKANMCSRFAIRILLPWAEGRAKDPEGLYRFAKKLPWEQVLSSRGTLFINSSVSSDFFDHSHYAALKVKDAIADRFREKTGKRPSVAKENPDLVIHLRIHESMVLISLDSSGDSLHRRGYRPPGAKAPLNETLAAAMIALSEWTPEKTLYIPMCGSGTLVMEAAMKAANLPSQWFRPHFGFMKWKDYDRKVVEEVRLEIWQGRNTAKVKILASDVDRDALRQTQSVVSKIAWEHDITIEDQNFFDLPEDQSGVTVILNPPYGERMRPENIEQMYRDMGLKLKNDFANGDAWIITSNAEALNHVGFRPHAKHTLYNGKLECKYYGFGLYQGSRKDKAVTEE
ncbi:MAG: THUMP domain-containing protein [Flavobacteriales bacterium]|nr:THUMP domain-containing protein [Flavobacteriales bacterium]